MNSAVVLGLYGPNSLGVIRSLGKEKIPVTGFHLNPKFPHASYSKYLGERFILNNEEELLSSLVDFGKKQSEKGVVFCTGDRYSLFTKENYSKLSTYFSLPLSEYGSLEYILDKSNMLDLGKKAGFNVPEHTRLSNENVYDIKFPIFLKPLLSTKGEKSDMILIKDKEELKIKRDSLLEKHTDLEVETFIPGPITNQVEIHSYLTSKGEPLIAGMLQYQKGFIGKGFEYATGWAHKTIHYPELLEPSNNLTKLLKFNGALDINLKKSSEDSKFYFNEVNLRSSANLMIDTKFGLNLPAIIYLDQNGKDFSHLENKEKQLDKYWISDRRLINYFERGFPVDNEKLEKLIKEESAHSIFDNEDISPFYISFFKGKLCGFNVDLKIY